MTKNNHQIKIDSQILTWHDGIIKEFSQSKYSSVIKSNYYANHTLQKLNVLCAEIGNNEIRIKLGQSNEHKNY